jgi:hypothetical protein
MTPRLHLVVYARLVERNGRFGIRIELIEHAAAKRTVTSMGLSLHVWRRVEIDQEFQGAWSRPGALNQRRLPELALWLARGRGFIAMNEGGNTSSSAMRLRPVAGCRPRRGWW